MPLSNELHHRLCIQLFDTINSYISSNNTSCTPCIAPLDVLLNENTLNHTVPDISIICKRDNCPENSHNLCPDWIIEVVSPSSRKTDYYTKLFKYFDDGVREYWIVDPDKNRISVYNFELEDFMDYTFSDSVTSGIYADFSIDFSKLNI